MPAPRLLPRSCYSSPLQTFLPWGPPASWTLTVSIISYHTFHLLTTSSHHPCRSTALHLLMSLPSNDIHGWGACHYPRCSLLLLEGCPTISSISVPPANPVLAWIWVNNLEHIYTTTVSSSVPIPWNLSPVNIHTDISQKSTHCATFSCLSKCMCIMSILQLPSTPHCPLVLTTSHLCLSATSPLLTALGRLYGFPITFFSLNQKCPIISSRTT